MSRFSKFFGRASTSQVRTPVGSIIQYGFALVAMYSAFALISHDLVAINKTEGPSMYPTIPSEESYTIYSRRHRRGKNIKVGDIIVFENPIFLRGRACKRVIGMPGDYIVRDPSQSPTVGGTPVPGVTDIDEVREEPVMVQVPEGHVWVAGDSLTYSRDSRFYGPLPMALIVGKVLYNGTGWFTWKSLRTTQFHPATQADHTSLEPVHGELGLEDAKVD
ncbi:signal peptidase I [Exophiala sideris]|uniref:Mitochondrial inner membrane protease subunit n=1 Tax=Exophiala sideris TaxID=1016849 RepID=A0A0D1XGN3_9EURO|nr:signal peptidase I [Exophiala sideris]